MAREDIVTGHYTHGSLFDAICDGARALGKSIDEVSIDDLAPVDEFHIGGRVATRAFLDQLDIQKNSHMLDVGCGIGGGSRYASDTYGCQVTGVDLTPEYIVTGNKLSQNTGFAEKVRLRESNATALGDDPCTYDGAFMLHCGMNIESKGSLASEIFRVLRPGARFGIYDVMRIGDGELVFPVPWAQDETGSSVDTVETYTTALERAGFQVATTRNRRDFALEFFKQLKLSVASAGGPPPLGLHILMGPDAPVKIKNMVENIARGVIAPVELIAEKSE